MRTLFIALSLLTLFSTTSALANEYKYIEAEQLQTQLLAKQAVLILDIQFLGAYKNGHFPGAIATYAYPLKTAASKAAIDNALNRLNNNAPIIIVSHRGGGGAMRTSDYLKEKGIDGSRISILSKGMQAWPYPEMVEVSNE